MYAFSAADAVAPAVQRTKTFLFSSFRWGTYLKLCLVALITEGLGNFRSSGNAGAPPSNQGPSISAPLDLTPGWIALMIAASVFFVVLCCILYYWITRLRFAYFYCLIHNTREIRPGWRLLGLQAARFFWLNLAVGACFVLLIALIGLPFVAGFWRLFREAQAGGHPDVGAILSFVLPLIPIVILVVLGVILADVILRDWMLPHYALDNASAAQAWAAVWECISKEKGQFLAYALLRVILPILAVIAVAIVLIIPTLILAAALGVIELGIHSAFAGATGAAAVAGLFLQAFFGVIGFGFALLASVCVGGPLSTAIREYALLFYGGRYQQLGDILAPASRAGIA